MSDSAVPTPDAVPPTPASAAPAGARATATPAAPAASGAVGQGAPAADASGPAAADTPAAPAVDTSEPAAATPPASAPTSPAAESPAAPVPTPSPAAEASTPPAAAAAPASPPVAPAPSRAELLLRAFGRQLWRGLRAIGRELAARRGLRTVLLGVIVTLVALRLGTDSALSVPLLVVGLGMVVIGAMGPRLRGHVSLDFGPEGTAFTVQTHIAPPGRRLAADPNGSPVVEVASRPRIALVPSAPATPAAPAASTPEPADANVVESHGETIEMDVAQLRALLEAERKSSAS